MAKIDFNTVVAGGYEVAVGNEYEVVPGKWGKLKAPTVALQERAAKMLEDESATTGDLCRIVLDGLGEYASGDAISGMEAAVAQDFFTLLAKMLTRLKPDLGE